MNLAQLLLDMARRQPHAPAVHSDAQSLSYSQLAHRVARMAGALVASGRQPGERVVLWMENCGAFFECLYGCWAAGTVAVPCNAKLHPREIAHVVSDCGATLVLTTPGLLSSANQIPGNIQILCTGTADYERLFAHEPIAPHASQPEDLAWLFYTSGTTGRPKGAMLSHRALLNMSLTYLADIDYLAPDDVMLHMAPLSHGSGLYALPFFLRGGQHRVMAGFDAEDLARALSEHTSVSFFAAPTMLTRLVNSPVAREIDPTRIGTISYGGGPMYVADLQRALEILGPRLYQLYGQGESPMTITGLDQAHHIGGDGPPLAERLASCGPARSGVLVRVVDEEDRDVPLGEIGEVITRSANMMSGYWNNPTASSETLRGGWLHTGDLGSLDAYGYLTLRDRSKDLIISGGSNIYPREIEEVLLRHPAIVEVSVVGRPHADWGEEVVAFVVLKEGAEAAPNELDALCLENIARFKRPKHYRFVSALPKNNYGKVLKSALRSALDRES